MTAVALKNPLTNIHGILRAMYIYMYMQTLSKSYDLCKFSCVGLIRGIPSGRGWAHHARSGSQSEHRIHLILPACAASYMIK